MNNYTKEMLLDTEDMVCESQSTMGAVLTDLTCRCCGYVTRQNLNIKEEANIDNKDVFISVGNPVISTMCRFIRSPRYLEVMNELQDALDEFVKNDENFYTAE